MDKAALGQIPHPLRVCSPVSIVLPLLRTHPFIHRRYIILAIDIVVKYHLRAISGEGLHVTKSVYESLVQQSVAPIFEDLMIETDPVSSIFCLRTPGIAEGFLFIAVQYSRPNLWRHCIAVWSSGVQILVLRPAGAD